MFANWSLPAKATDMLLSLIELNGDKEVLLRARELLANAGEEVLQCIDELEQISVLSKAQLKDAPLYFDLAELRGYNYYTGFTFAAYVPSQGQGIAFGGRYDDVGEAFGRARPATGFSTDVKNLYSLIKREATVRAGIYAPCSDLPGLHEIIESLRQQGEIVISALPGQSGDATDMGCDRRLEIKDGQWNVVEIHS
jgi:ATP phosphoribosyltransferase regulatory subunit